MKTLLQIAAALFVAFASASPSRGAPATITVDPNDVTAEPWCFYYDWENPTTIYNSIGSWLHYTNDGEAVCWRFKVDDEEKVEDILGFHVYMALSDDPSLFYRVSDQMIPRENDLNHIYEFLHSDAVIAIQIDYSSTLSFNPGVNDYLVWVVRDKGVDCASWSAHAESDGLVRRKKLIHRLQHIIQERYTHTGLVWISQIHFEVTPDPLRHDLFPNHTIDLVKLEAIDKSTSLVVHSDTIPLKPYDGFVASTRYVKSNFSGFAAFYDPDDYTFRVTILYDQASPPAELEIQSSDNVEVIDMRL